jgi:hypothetical protein
MVKAFDPDAFMNQPDIGLFKIADSATRFNHYDEH